MMQLTEIEKDVVRKHIQYAGMKEEARLNKIGMLFMMPTSEIDRIIKYAISYGLYAEQIALMKKENKSYKRR
jgi:hypothetical protein